MHMVPVHIHLYTRQMTKDEYVRRYKDVESLYGKVVYDVVAVDARTGKQLPPCGGLMCLSAFDPFKAPGDPPRLIGIRIISSHEGLIKTIYGRDLDVFIRDVTHVHSRM